VLGDILSVCRSAGKMHTWGCQQIASEVRGNRYENNKDDDRNRSGGVTSPPTGLGMNKRGGNRLRVRKSVRAYGPRASTSERPVGQKRPYSVQAVDRHTKFPVPFAPEQPTITGESFYP
jgi:hypothetical protein